TCCTEPMPRPSGRCTSGPKLSNATGTANCSESKNELRQRPKQRKKSQRRKQMIASETGIENLTLNINQEIYVDAPLDATFVALLEQIGPANTTSDGKPFPMKLEPWPGGRWYRDLGDGNGHLWAHVQAVKRPALLEFTGPLFMSYPAVSNVQYRLTEQNGGTLIKFHH